MLVIQRRIRRDKAILKWLQINWKKKKKMCTIYKRDVFHFWEPTTTLSASKQITADWCRSEFWKIPWERSFEIVGIFNLDSIPMSCIFIDIETWNLSNTACFRWTWFWYCTQMFSINLRCPCLAIIQISGSFAPILTFTFHRTHFCPLSGSTAYLSTSLVCWNMIGDIIGLIMLRTTWFQQIKNHNVSESFDFFHVQGLLFSLERKDRRRLCMLFHLCIFSDNLCCV